MSGGVLRAYDYSESVARPWKGVLAFRGWLGGKERLDCATKMAVAIVNGDADKNANSCVPRDTQILEKEKNEEVIIGIGKNHSLRDMLEAATKAVAASRFSAAMV